MSVVVEYLLIVRKNGTFCETADALTRMLEIDSSVQIEGGKIRYCDNFECDYGITSGEITGKDQTFFHLRFSSEGCDTRNEIETFSSLLKIVRSVMSKVGGQPETLWDDISFYYSKDTYQLIYRVENLMRKLIANFMLVTVGAEWIDESAPGEVKEVIAKSKRKEYLNVLHNIDFIHLADFLLRPYSNDSTGELHAQILKANTEDDLLELKRLVPMSNWTRYFSALVDCDDNYLKKRWENLYDLRCLIAHNAIFKKADFDRVHTLVEEIEGKLVSAISKLPQVNVPEGDIELIAENAASRISELIGEFISAWKALEVVAFQKSSDRMDGRNTFRRAIEAIHRQGIVNRSQYERIIELSQLRNSIVHSSGVEVSDSELVTSIRAIGNITKIISDDK